MLPSMKDEGGVHPDSGQGAPPNPPPGDAGSTLVLLLLVAWLVLTGYGLHQFLKLLGIDL